METITTQIQKNGKLIIEGLYNLAGKEVDIIIVPKREKQAIIHDLDSLKASFGTIKSNVQLSNQDLRRENIYGDDER